ncbi:MAG: transglutaminase-like domain-containing protein, partial [Planctomycetota bacterium]|nr:transglutaminase-like domain-containing protein [Planctomycetota bacterium]
PSVPRPGGPMQRADEGKLPETDDGSSDGSGGVSPEMAFAGNSTTPFSEEVVLYVYPEEGAPPGPSVHLRDMVLDHFTQSSVRAANRRTPPLYLDEDDGRQDGWTEVARAGSDVDFETHRIRSRRLYLSAQSEWTLLFAPHPLAAIEIPRLHYHPDAVLFTPEVVDEWFDYRVRSAVVDTSPAALRGLSRSSSVSSQNTRLPVSSPALQAIADQAAEWTRSASSDYEIVAAIVGRLRSEFEYELRDLDFRGPDALLQFLEERKGYCTYFATAAAMMLRTRGIPARVATGFLAHEWVASEGRYVVREKDAHAWIEVAFDRVGWVTFDPTPAGAQEFGSELLAQEDLDSRPPFSERIRGAIEDWLSDDGSLGAVLATLLRWPAEVLRRYPALWLLPSGLFFLILHLLLRRRQRPRWDEGPLDLPRRTVGLFQRLAQTRTRTPPSPESDPPRVRDRVACQRGLRRRRGSHRAVLPRALRWSSPRGERGAVRRAGHP